MNTRSDKKDKERSKQSQSPLAMSILGDFTEPDRLHDLVQLLTDDGNFLCCLSLIFVELCRFKYVRNPFSGRENHRFENFSLQNIAKWILAGNFAYYYS